MLAATWAGAALAAPAPDESVAAKAPRSVADLACPPPRPYPANLIAPADLPPQAATPNSGGRAEFLRRLQVDPAGLCRYRDENRALPPARPNRVVFLGDSITEGWKLGAPDLFADDVIDRGISGQNTSQMLLRFRDDVIELHPRVVHIMAGVNDINTPAGTVLTRSNIVSMVDLAQAHGITVVLASITPSSRFAAAPDVVPGPQIVAMNDWIRAFAAERRIPFVDYWTPMQDGRLGMRSELTNEGLHPNRRGYAVMTPLATAAVARALSLPRLTKNGSPP